jgi:hypothetical protein
LSSADQTTSIVLSSCSAANIARWDFQRLVRAWLLLRYLDKLRWGGPRSSLEHSQRSNFVCIPSPRKPHARPIFYMEKSPIIPRLRRSQICQSSKIPSLQGSLDGHCLGLLRQSVQVVPSRGTRLVNVWRGDLHWRKLLRLVIGLIRCEIEWEAKIETVIVPVPHPVVRLLAARHRAT